MKVVIVLAASIALCAGNEVLSVPGDNSHYIEGESRFIWMPDGDGVPLLVDLEESFDEELLNTRYGANNEYWLYTRKNPNISQLIVKGNANSAWNSNYASGRPLKVLVHGWQNNGNSSMNTLIKSAFLEEQDANVIVVDWHAFASSNYLTAAEGVPEIGEYLGNFLIWLINTAGGNWDNVHLVGFSLGAHVVGNAGRQVDGRAARVTGLDPAGPKWHGNSKALNKQSGQYVEAIHTDGGVFGILEPIAHADFYPNGGKNPQPGCCLMSTCSHSRAYELFASSVLNNSFKGRGCKDLDQAKSVKCNGSIFSMGNGIISKRGFGIFGLKTGSSYPFFFFYF
ncbi:pancreatic lipase-related protein 2-like, partial [Achroia grisella]|uniref:pancreatic lipase-related protein 2-like n=1 Tax=Achroia grisella TaxID=688607 RepID=UPI0027D331FC